MAPALSGPRTSASAAARAAFPPAAARGDAEPTTRLCVPRSGAIAPPCASHSKNVGFSPARASNAANGCIPSLPPLFAPHHSPPRARQRKSGGRRRGGGGGRGSRSVTESVPTTAAPRGPPRARPAPRIPGVRAGRRRPARVQRAAAPERRERGSGAAWPEAAAAAAAAADPGGAGGGQGPQTEGGELIVRVAVRGGDPACRRRRLDDAGRRADLLTLRVFPRPCVTLPSVESRWFITPCLSDRYTRTRARAQTHSSRPKQSLKTLHFIDHKRAVQARPGRVLWAAVTVADSSGCVLPPGLDLIERKARRPSKVCRFTRRSPSPSLLPNCRPRAPPLRGPSDPRGRCAAPLSTVPTHLDWRAGERGPPRARVPEGGAGGREEKGGPNRRWPPPPPTAARSRSRPFLPHGLFAEGAGGVHLPRRRPPLHCPPQLEKTKRDTRPPRARTPRHERKAKPNKKAKNKRALQHERL